MSEYERQVHADAAYLSSRLSAAKLVTDAEFESLIQRLPNPVITSNGHAKFLTVGVVTYTTPLVTRGVA